MTDLELQLKVWKELAVSKQVLMRTVTDALKLDPSCSQEELKAALEAAIKRSNDADTKVSEAQGQAKAAIAAMEGNLAGTQKALAVAEAARAELVANQEKMQQQLADERTQASQELKKLKERLAERERELKAINTALADTPENVIKKLKVLKKDKMDESNARKQAEKAAATLRTDKKKLEEKLKVMEEAQGSASQLAAQHRELHTLCGTLHEQLSALAEDAASLPAIPTLDSALVEKLESADAEGPKKAAGKGKR